ncbi:MAG: site-specific integrase [Patescibacteria group bacterium]|nr:site-specific integrase [Patescibacteria group bacterium]
MRHQIDAFNQNISARRAARTASSYSATLAAFADFLDQQYRTGRPTTSDVDSFLARPTKEGGRRAPATRNQELAALRAFGEFATKQLGWTENPTEGIPFLREPPHDPAVLTAFEVRRLFLVASQFQDSIRRSFALAVLALLSQVGLRVHELVALAAYDGTQVRSFSAVTAAGFSLSKYCSATERLVKRPPSTSPTTSANTF